MRKFFRLLDLFDIGVRFSVITLVVESLYLAGGGSLSDLHVKFRGYVRNRPTLGTWVEALLPAAEDLRGRAGNTAFTANEIDRVEMAEQKIRTCALVDLRNRTRGHAYTQPGQEYERLFKDHYSDVYAVLKTLEGVLSVHLVSVERIRYDQGARCFSVSGRLLMGSNPAFETVQFTSAQPLEDNQVAFLRPTDRRPVSLLPLVLWRECPECHHNRVLVTDSESTYIDAQMGHRVKLPNIGA